MPPKPKHSSTWRQCLYLPPRQELIPQGTRLHSSHFCLFFPWLGEGGDLWGAEMSHLACHSPPGFRAEGLPQSPNLHSPWDPSLPPRFTSLLLGKTENTIPVPGICSFPTPSIGTQHASSPARVPEPSRLPDVCIYMESNLLHPLPPSPALSSNPQPR